MPILPPHSKRVPMLKAITSFIPGAVILAVILLGMVYMYDWFQSGLAGLVP